MALAETMQRFRLAGLAGQVGIWEWDLDSDKMIIEPHSRSLLGYDATQENARTADWRTHIHQEDLPKVIQAAHDHAHGLTPQFEIQHRMMDNGRNVRWFLSRGQAQRRGHHPTRMIGSSIDITDRKLAEDERLRAQEALQEKQAELAHLSRAATIGALSVALAHEINQPLSAILTNAQTAQRLLENAALDERELDEIMLDIEKDGRRAGEVIQKLRNLLRRGEGDFNLIQIGSVVDDVLHLLHSELVDRRVTVVRATTSEPDSIFGDTIQLQQVLLNLLNNATDAMSGLEPSARKIAISIGRTKTGGIRISVSDCGSGLSAEDRVRLFQPFFTTKRNGLGLGLSISKSIVEAHAGKLWAENNRNGGATFHIELPAAPQAQIG
jgi:C4-dicarboxylate-specific signal transduction histidine kinase